MLKQLKQKAHDFLLYLQDQYEVITGKRNSMVPPARFVHINAGSAEKIGHIFFTYFVELAGLKKTDHVLDVGSGYGRMAVPLTGFLSSHSRYEGLEIIEAGVNWCNKKITPKFRNFKFHKIDVQNGRYNPNGNTRAADYMFPFKDESFDFVLLTSVFTHMMPADFENYLAEISRVLKPGGTCFITYFLLNPSSEKMIKAGKSRFTLKHTFETCRIESETDPEFVVAFKQKNIQNSYEKYNLKFKSVHYGSWCGRTDFLDFQDIIIAQKLGQ